MEKSEPTIVSAERIDGGLQIVFSNGREAFYVQELLYSIIDQASNSAISIEQREEQQAAEEE